MRKISLSNFTHLNKNKVKDFHSGTEGLICQKNCGGWSGFGKALTWDPSRMITCHPKKIPKFLLKGGEVQFCPTLKKEFILFVIVWCLLMKLKTVREWLLEIIVISVKTVSSHRITQELSNEDYKVETGRRIFSMITTRCYTVVQNVGNLKLCSMEGNIV